MKDLDSEAGTITIGVAHRRDPDAHGPFPLVTESLTSDFLMALSPPLPSFIDHRPNLDLHVLDPGLSFSPITFDYDGAQDLPTTAPRSWKDEPSSTILVRRTYPFHSSVISNVTF